MSKIKILVVDDMPNIKKTITEGLKKMGYEPEIDLKVPTSDSYPFGCDFPSPNNLGNYDLALVDLELDPDKREGIMYEPQDLGGGTYILPYLREHSPWLSVIAISRLYDNIDNHFLSIASSFGFDGQIYRRSFSSQTFNRPLFDTLLKHARLLRRNACMGLIPKISENNPEIDCSVDCDSRLKQINPDWQNFMKLIFWFAEKVVIVRGNSGYSGSVVLKAFARISIADGGEESEWILKINESPTKLQREVVSHQKMSKKGINHAMMVPILWPSVLHENKMAVIGYQFAKGSEPASKYLKNASQVISMLSQIENSLHEFYNNQVKDRTILSEIIKDWIGDPKYYVIALKE